MSVPLRLCGPARLTASAADLYKATGPTLLKQVIAANSSASPVTVRLSLVPAGGTADGTNVILPDATVGAHDVLVLDAEQVLNLGDKLNGLASTTNVIVLTVSGEQ